MTFSLSPWWLLHDKDNQKDCKKATDRGSTKCPVPVTSKSDGKTTTNDIAETAEIIPHIWIMQVCNKRLVRGRYANNNYHLDSYNFSFNVFAVIREHFVSGNIIIQLNSSLVDKIYLLGWIRSSRTGKKVFSTVNNTARFTSSTHCLTRPSTNEVVHSVLLESEFIYLGRCSTWK